MVITKVAGFASALVKLGAGFGALGLAVPEVLLLVGAVVALYEAYKHAKEIAEWFGLGGGTETKYVSPTGKPSSRAAVAAEAARGARVSPASQSAFIQNYLKLAHPGPMVTHEAAEAVKVELHLDSVKVAEAMLHNPRSRRQISEGAAKYALQMTARK